MNNKFNTAMLIAVLAACDAQPQNQKQPQEMPGEGEGQHMQIDPPKPEALAARETERLTIDQIAASFETVLGQPWTVTLDDGTPLYVDRLSPLYGALGGADYYSRLAEAMDPHLLFAKLMLQGAWIACDDAAAADESLPSEQRRLSRHEDPRENIRDLKLRFHGIRADDTQLEPYLELFEAVSSLAGHRPIDGWRAVCVALVTEPEFVIY